MALPAACSDCLNLLQLARPGALPQQMPWQFLRSAGGLTRLNFATVSIITNPAEALRILLDHAAMEARLMPLQPGIPGIPSIPGMHIPGLALPAGLPGAAALSVLELGRMLIEGEQALGRRYTLPSGNIAEVWMNNKLQLPVLTKFTGSFGLQTCRCRNTSIGEPDPSLFQIPPGYRTIPLTEPRP